MATEKIQRPVNVFIDSVRVLELMNCTYSTENNSSFTYTSGGAILQKGQKAFSLSIQQVNVVRGQSVDIDELVLSAKQVMVHIPRGDGTYEAKGIFTRGEGSSDNTNGQHHGSYTFSGVDPKILKG